MRYVVGFVLVLTLGASPRSVSAQAGEESTTSEPNLQESAPPAEEAHEEGGLSPRLRKRTRQKWDPDTYKLRLDSSGLSLSPPPVPRRKTDARLRQYRQGLIVSSLSLGIGGALIGSGVVVLRNWNEEQSQEPMPELVPPAGTYVLFSLGIVAALGGLIGAAISGSKLGARKRELRELQAARRRNPAGVSWDPAQSRLVFSATWRRSAGSRVFRAGPVETSATPQRNRRLRGDVLGFEPRGCL